MCHIFNPFGHLTVRVKGGETLSGVADVEALEYRFSKAATAGRRYSFRVTARAAERASEESTTDRRDRVRVRRSGRHPGRA